MTILPNFLASVLLLLGSSPATAGPGSDAVSVRPPEPSGGGAQTLGVGYPWTNHGFPFTFVFGNHIDSHQQTLLLPNGDLLGFLYITYTGEVTPTGLPVAKHPDSMTPAGERVVGWVLRGKPGHATFVHHMMDHPLWLVAQRADIPQPGGYSHMHWLGLPAMAGMLVEGDSFDGYFLELTAVRTFAFEHGGEKIPVYPGLDLRTHLNVVSSFPGY